MAVISDIRGGGGCGEDDSPESSLCRCCCCASSEFVISPTSRSSGDDSALAAASNVGLLFIADADAVAEADVADAAAFSISVKEAILLGFDFFRRFLDEDVVDGVMEKGVEAWSKGFDSPSFESAPMGGAWTTIGGCIDWSDGGVMDEG